MLPLKMFMGIEHSQRLNRWARPHRLIVPFTFLLFLCISTSFGLPPSAPETIPALYSEPQLPPRELEKNITYQRLVRAVGDPDFPSWDARVRTGRMLWCLMRNPGAVQSTWTFDDLERWGWDEIPMPDSVMGEWQAPLSGAYHELGITASHDSIHGFMHERSFLDDEGVEQQDSLGAFQNLVNGQDSSIVAGYNTSPASSLGSYLGHAPDPNEVPRLQKWSDVVALQWQKYAAGGTLKYIFRSNVANDNTKGMMRRAFLLAGKTSIPTYPGIDFVMDTNQGADENSPAAQQFYGLLGTLHGAGPAYLLAQHHSLFGGQKRITKIKVWAEVRAWPTDGSQGYDELVSSMLFFVEAVPTSS
ncbi:hypothetical protein PT974_08232 [Cladobotryum mycophilum]|uniref:Uncharacterized protein n=1 Tax=Cladobotryum mycophilum TaxID=491253 RepID=A0ABR0SCT8_9HYPO